MKNGSISDLRTMVGKRENKLAIVMWSIGNEIGEADGNLRSLATVKRLIQVIKAVDKHAMSLWEQISSAW